MEISCLVCRINTDRAVMFPAICSSHAARGTSQAQASASRNRPFMEKFCFIFHLLWYLWSRSVIRLILSSYLCGFSIEDGRGRWLWGGGTASTDTVLPYRASAEMSYRRQGGHQPAWGPAEKHAVASVLMCHTLPRAVSPPNTTDMQASLDTGLLHRSGEEKWKAFRNLLLVGNPGWILFLG